jgi:hypothetical protein
MGDKDKVRTVQYVDMAGVGAWFDPPVTGRTVAKWRARYAQDHPCPAPDAMVGDRTPGWLPERRGEWLVWAAGRSGQGVGGGPKSSKTTNE